MDNINPSTVISWLRQQAVKFNGMADEMERTFGAASQQPPQFLQSLRRHEVVLPPTMVDEIASAIRRVIGTKKMRRADIASITGFSQSELDAALRQENGFTIGDRGWISITSASPGDE